MRQRKPSTNRLAVMLIAGLAVALAFLPANSLADGEKSTSNEQELFFEKHIRPVLASRCYRCHGEKRQRSGLRVDSRAMLLRGGDRGPAIVPGNPAKSLLIQALQHGKKDLKMPPGKKLAEHEIEAFVAWIRAGAPWPGEDRIGQQIAEAEKAKRGHWAFQPIRKVEPPRIADPDWNSPIDRFIKKELDARGLRPVELADRATLIRRATIDLIGLPPTPAQVKAFVADDSPDAFAKLVDRLLASPHYGERWGRHWLDVVRYSDTAGCNSDFPIPEAYRYRNYVIDAFNADMPYDQFLQEQIAGDLMPAKDWAERERRLIATGYIASARRFGSVVLRYPWHLTIDDTIDNLGKAVLGLTLSCARCHDHKFDPITMEDYYGLYGIFASTQYPWPGIELAPVPRKLVPLVPQSRVAAAMREFEKKMQPHRQRLAKVEADYWKVKAQYDANPRSTALEQKEWQLKRLFRRLLKEEGKLILKYRPKVPYAYAVADGDIADARIHIKGDPKQLGRRVPRGFPAILGGQKLSPEVAAKTSGRLQLAQWLTDSRNPLTARVIVNRVWLHHFGRGIVPTPNNFGRQGQPPTHPDLLDYLARRFIENGWSIKALHREIMLTRVYRLASRSDQANVKIDPDNKYYWRQNRQRLDAETLRDALLFVSGELKLQPPKGPHPFPPPEQWRYTQHRPFADWYESRHRSVYLLNKRLRRPAFFAMFDGADPNASVGQRTESVTSTQALYFLNNEAIARAAEKLVGQLPRGTDAEKVNWLYLRLFARPADASEIDLCTNYLSQVESKVAGTDTRRNDIAWQSLARALLRTNEFLYVN